MLMSVMMYNFLYSLDVLIELSASLSVLLLALMLCHIGVFNAINSIKARFNIVAKKILILKILL